MASYISCCDALIFPPGVSSRCPPSTTITKSLPWPQVPQGVFSNRVTVGVTSLRWSLLKCCMYMPHWGAPQVGMPHHHGCLQFCLSLLDFSYGHSYHHHYRHGYGYLARPAFHPQIASPLPPPSPLP